MKNQMTIGRRFALLAAILIAFISVQGGLSLYLIHSLSNSVNTVVTDPLPGVYRISQISSALHTIRADAWKHMAAGDPAQKAMAEQEMAENKKVVDNDLTDYEKTITTTEDRDLFTKIGPAISQYEQVLETEVLPLSRAGKTEEAVAKYLGEADAIRKNAEVAVNAEVDLNRRNGVTDGSEAQSRASSGTTMITLILLIAVASGIAFAWFMVKTVTRALMGAVTELAQGADQIASAAQQVSTASQSLAQGSSEQAASIEETSSSSEEINSMAQQNTDNCKQVAALMAESQDSFHKADSALSEMVVAMAEINSSSDKIAKIIRVIDEIAFQTNILALNAAVEAARAGEAGMGFAVVADEVRNLAQRCAQAAKDTAGLIEDSIQKSNAGKIKTDSVAKGIHSIIAQSTKVQSLVDSVNAGSMEQARGIDQVTKAIGQMGQVTQQTAATAEESASAAEELSAQSESLQAIVTQLTALVTSVQANAHNIGTYRPQMVSRR